MGGKLPSPLITDRNARKRTKSQLRTSTKSSVSGLLGCYPGLSHVWLLMLSFCYNLIVWASPSTGHAGARNGQRRVENNDFSYFIQEPTHHEVHLNCFGVMLRIDSRNAPPSGQRGRLPGTGMAEMRRNLYVGPSWGYVGPSGVMLGAMFANLGVIWGYVATSWPPAGPCCGRCWTVGHPPR